MGTNGPVVHAPDGEGKGLPCGLGKAVRRLAGRCVEIDVGVIAGGLHDCILLGAVTAFARWPRAAANLGRGVRYALRGLARG
jgi:hypothetical protein